MLEILPTLLAILSVLVANALLLLLIAKYIDRQSFYVFATAFLFFLLGAACMAPAFIWGTIWTMPGIGVAFAFVVASILFLAQGCDTVYAESRRRRREKLARPLNPTEVEKGLDWKELERWLGRQSGRR